MKNIPFLFFNFFLGASCLFSQTDVEKWTYENNEGIRHLEENPSLFSEVIISDYVKDEIYKDENDFEKPIYYFIKGIFCFQNGEIGNENKWFDKVLKLKPDSVCANKKSISEKIYCVNCIRDLKAAILIKKIHKLFEIEATSDYCDLYQKYKVDIESEKAKYKFELLGAGNDDIEILFWWRDSYNLLVPRFIESDCFMETKQFKKAFSLLVGSISNSVLSYPENETIQRIVGKRVFTYLKVTGQTKIAKKELRTIIKGFKKNAEPVKIYFYNYNHKLFDIPIQFSSYEYSSNNHTNIISKRFRRGKPIKTKREIIKEFKQTKYYKVICSGRL